MKTNNPLDDLEMFELLRLCYPDKFKDDEDKTWDKAMDFIDEMSGFDEIADLLGRIIMLTNPMKSELTNRLWHCFGQVETKDEKIDMIAVVTRECL